MRRSPDTSATVWECITETNAFIFISISSCRGCRSGVCASVDPFDQPAAAPSRTVGGDGVSAASAAEESHLDSAQAAFAVAVADGGLCGRGADGCPADLT